MKIAQERNLLSEQEVNHPVETAQETERKEIVPKENDLLKVVATMTGPVLGGILQEDVHQKTIKGPALPGDIHVRGEDQDLLLVGTTGDTQDLLQGDTGETQGQDHLLENRSRRPKKSILTSKSEERCSTSMSVRYFGTDSSGWPRLRPRLKTTSTSKSRERVLKSIKRN